MTNISFKKRLEQRREILPPYKTINIMTNENTPLSMLYALKDCLESYNIWTNKEVVEIERAIKEKTNEILINKNKNKWKY